MLKSISKLLAGGRGSRAVSSNDGGEQVIVNAYCTCSEVKAPSFSHSLNGHRDLSDPELSGHLDGFIGYLMSRGTGEMTAQRYHLMRHIQRVQHHLSFTIGESQFDAVAKWAGEANAILFLADGSVRNPAGRILITASGEHPDADADVPYPHTAWERKRRIDAALAEKGIRTPKSLPPVIAESEVKFRSPEEVAQRALALFAVAVRAESIANKNPLSVAEIQEPLPRPLHLSPMERAFLAESDPSSQAVVQFVWRYEALWVLLWSIGVVDELPFPTRICDVPLVARTMLEHGDSMMRGAKQRPTAEILDVLDLHFRAHWAVRQATQIDKVDPPAGLEPGVVLERHYALNWLVRHEEKEWDEVDTAT